MDDLELNILERSQLIVKKPLEQLGLVTEIPAGVVPVAIINDYISKEKLRCAVCRTELKHKEGRTFRLSDGSICLSGLDCARKHFGSDVMRKVEIAFKDAKQKVILDALVAPSLAVIDVALNEIGKGWVSCERSCKEIARQFTDSLKVQGRPRLVDSLVSDDSKYHLFQKLTGSISFAETLLNDSKALLSGEPSPKCITTANLKRLSAAEKLISRSEFIKHFLATFADDSLEIMNQEIRSLGLKIHIVSYPSSK